VLKVLKVTLEVRDIQELKVTQALKALKVTLDQQVM
jgi:hypothetical protein